MSHLWNYLQLYNGRASKLKETKCGTLHLHKKASSQIWVKRVASKNKKLRKKSAC